MLQSLHSYTVLSEFCTTFFFLIFFLFLYLCINSRHIKLCKVYEEKVNKRAKNLVPKRKQNILTEKLRKQFKYNIAIIIANKRGCR